MNANKHPRIDLRFDVVQSVANQMGRAGETKAHVVTLSFDCIYIFGADKEECLAILDRESLQIPRPRTELLQHVEDPCGIRFPDPFHKNLRLIDSLCKAFS